MNIGIVGLGLIGGSVAKTIKARTSHKMYLYDISAEAVSEATLYGLYAGELNEDTLPVCDIVIIALYPREASEYLANNAARFKKGGIVVDCVGVKSHICKVGNALAAEHGFFFVGGHPMAGTQFSGFRHSRNSLFKGASMILTPIAEWQSIPELEKNVELLKNFFKKLEFTSVIVTTPENHDKVIAYTSQLAHVVSSCYIKSPRAEEHKGFSAGSYKDMTRVARINEEMWTELFEENSKYLINEVDELITHLQEYRDALSANDSAELNKLLREGRIRKERVEKSEQ